MGGARKTNVEGQVVPAECDPNSRDVHPSLCPILDGIMFVSKVRERDPMGNRVPRRWRPRQRDERNLAIRMSERSFVSLGDRQ